MTTINSKTCPAESRGAAAAGALLIDRVTSNTTLVAQVKTLEATARTHGEAALAQQLASSHDDVRALMEQLPRLKESLIQASEYIALRSNGACAPS